MDASYIYAMPKSWEDEFINFFPFSMIRPILNKISAESIKILVIVIIWPTQTWFKKLLEVTQSDQ